MKLKTIRDLKKINGYKILLRVDFNIGLDARNSVKDDFRIVMALPTIRYLMRYGCRIVIISHLGEPAGDPLDRTSLSLRPVAMRLGELLDKNIEFIQDLSEFTVERLARLEPGSIMMLENLRFDPGEKKNDRIFAEKLAKPFGGENAGMTVDAIFVNEAFSVCHRKHASVSAIKEFLPAYAGFLLEKECTNLDRALDPEKPAIAVMGGSKISTKISLIKNLLPRYDRILIGGAMANNFIKANGMEIGRSLYSDEDLQMARELACEKISLPLDVIVSDTEGSGGRVTQKKVGQVGKKDYIYDIGPETIRTYSAHIKKAKTIVWNGPLGMFEITQFKHGTNSIAQLIASRSKGSAFGIVGGGETIEALDRTGMKQYVDWVSTGGGAMLAYLGDEPMPGLEGLYEIGN